MLPFAPWEWNAAADSLGARLAEGVAAELVRDARLGVVPSIRTSRYRDPREIPADIAQLLGARFMLRGRAVLDNGQLRAEVVLTDDERNRKFWVADFTAAIDQREDLERRIAHAAATAAAAELDRR